MCLLFVFLALVQFAYVNVLSRVQKRRKHTTSSTVGQIALGTALFPTNSAAKPSPTVDNSAGNDVGAKASPLARFRKLGMTGGEKAANSSLSSLSEPANTEPVKPEDVEFGNSGSQKVSSFVVIFSFMTQECYSRRVFEHFETVH